MLKTNILYAITEDNGDVTYGRTPDGIGMYWYDEDDLETALGDVEPVTSTMYFDGMDEFQEHRDDY